MVDTWTGGLWRANTSVRSQSVSGMPSGRVKGNTPNITDRPPFEDRLPEKGAIRFELRQHRNHFATVDRHQGSKDIFREFGGQPTDRAIEHADVGSTVAHPAGTWILVDV